MTRRAFTTLCAALLMAGAPTELLEAKPRSLILVLAPCNLGLRPTDSDNVLLLHAVDPPGGFNDLPASRPSIGAAAPPSALVTATIYSLRPNTRSEFSALFRERLSPALRDAGITPRGVFATEHSPNTYPALPVREGEEVVWFASFESAEAQAASVDRLSRSQSWVELNLELGKYLKAPPELLRLRPTGRLLLR